MRNAKLDVKVLVIEQRIVGKKPVLALPYRRLVCYCRMYQVRYDLNTHTSSPGDQARVFTILKSTSNIFLSTDRSRKIVFFCRFFFLPKNMSTESGALVGADTSVAYTILDITCNRFWNFR